MPDREPRGARLLAIAREAIEQEEPAAAWVSEEWLRVPGASFVTLRKHGELRGCIGSIDARRPLGEDVAGNARAAAYRDPRFPPVSPDELAQLAVEVSVLSAREPIAVSSEVEAVRSLHAGVDGIYLAYGGASATFLPQVWESIPDPLEFLTELRRKAQLPGRFWHPDLRLWRYSVEKHA